MGVRQERLSNDVFKMPSEGAEFSLQLSTNRNSCSASLLRLPIPKMGRNVGGPPNLALSYTAIIPAVRENIPPCVAVGDQHTNCRKRVG